MKKVLFIKTAIVLVSLLLCYNMSYSTPCGSVNQGRYMDASGLPGPVDELISLLEEYGNAMANAEDKATCDSLETELCAQLSYLDSKYPDYEPDSRDMTIIEKAFNRYLEQTESTTYFDDSDDNELDAETLEELSAIYETYSEIDDLGERFLAITSDYTQKIESAENVAEVIELANQYTGIIENYYDDWEPSDSEKPKFESALEKIGNAVNTALEKAMKEEE